MVGLDLDFGTRTMIGGGWVGGGGCLNLFYCSKLVQIMLLSLGLGLGPSPTKMSESFD